MNVWTENILNGFITYFSILPLIVLITALFVYMKKGSVRLVRFVGAQCLVLYFICLIEIVLFPLPTMEKIASMHGYNGQFIPLKFVSDILRDRSLESILQVLLNILMTVPFGFFFKFFLNMKRRNIILLTFLLSLIIELSQLTGLFFTYPGSYRLFDVDDLMTNTLGGFLGTVLANNINDLMPDLDKNTYVSLDTLVK
ncbi:MAG: VanZ family protein [Lachnospiraceae bacterium]|nr:VanZ family protein [Lachnospiraceae bacterium]